MTIAGIPCYTNRRQSEGTDLFSDGNIQTAKIGATFIGRRVLVSQKDHCVSSREDHNSHTGPS